MSTSAPTEGLPPDIDRRAYPVITHSILTPLALFVVIVRLTARCTSSGLKFDDVFIILATLCALTNWPLTIIGAIHGVGRHASYLDLPDIIAAVRSLVIGEFLLLLGLCFVKVSVLIFLLNIGGTYKWVKYVLKVNLVLIGTSTTAFCVVLWVQCTPIEGNWNPTVPGRKCIPLEGFMIGVYALSAVTVLTDFLCALLPLPIIWRLKLSAKTRMGIIAVIGLGLLTAASSIVRIALVKNFKTSRIDPTMSLVNVGVWTLIELHIAIIVASIPPCRALVLRLWARIRGKPGSSSGSNGIYLEGISGIEIKRSIHVTSDDSRAGNEGYLRMQDFGDRVRSNTDRS